MSEKQIAGQEQAKQIPHSAESDTTKAQPNERTDNSLTGNAFFDYGISVNESERRKEVREKTKRLEQRLKADPAAQAKWDKAVGSCNSIEELEQLNTYRLAAADVNALKPFAKKICSLLSKSVTNIIQVGEQLIEAKKIAGHGKWCLWIKDNCGISQDSVTRYMQLAEVNADNPELLKNVTGLKEAYIACGIITPKPKASTEPPAVQVSSSDATLTAPEPVKPAEPPATVPSTEPGNTDKAQQKSGSGDKQPKVSYLEKAFEKGRLTLAEAVEFLINHKEQIEDIELLKPLADYYAMKTQAFHLNPVEVQEAIAA